MRDELICPHCNSHNVEKGTSYTLLSRLKASAWGISAGFALAIVILKFPLRESRDPFILFIPLFIMATIQLVLLYLDRRRALCRNCRTEFVIRTGQYLHKRDDSI